MHTCFAIIYFITAIYFMDQQQEATSALQRICAALDPFILEDTNTSLLGGYTGVALFYAYYYQLTGNEEHLDKVHHIIEKCLQALSEEPMNGSHCSGIAGVSWCIQHLGTMGFIEADDTDDTFADIDLLVADFMASELAEGRNDFLHHGLGTALYFLERLPAEIARYGALGIAYADSAFAPAFGVSAANDGALRVTLSKQTSVGTVRYTTDGSVPTAASPAYAKPLDFPANDKVTLRAATFTSDALALSAPRTQRVDADALLGRDGNDLASCSEQAEPMRVVGARSHGSRPIYKTDVDNMCWRWPHAPLNEVKRIALSVDRVAWQFGDEATGAVVRKKTGAAGDIEIHIDACDGPLLAHASLASAPGELTADVTTPASAGAHDVCILATGDPRDGVWTLAHIALQKGGAAKSRASN